MAAEQQRPPVAPYVVYHAFRPQVAIYSSPDVDKLAAGNGLRNLAQLLKPWEASVERVTLRTSTFVSHVVPVFPLLIDDCRNVVHTELDALFLDGLSEWITKRVPEWLKSMDPIDVHDESDEDLWKEGTINELTPWYGFYRESLVNLRPRTEYETFGHPVACIIAVSTSNPEPLNAFAELYDATSPERLFADKPWVDPNVLRYYVLVHDATTGPAEDFAPLLEDIRRAYGLHTNMLVLNSEVAPKPDSAYMDASQRPLPKPADFSKYWTEIPPSPTLPRFESGTTTPDAPISQLQDKADDVTIEAGAKLGEEDVRRIKLFLREFVVQNLAPWLERTTSQLNEQLAANRKGIAGRLFSAGRRYFGSRPASPATGSSNASAFDPVKGFYRHTSQEAQTRRLADFALMIADYRLAATNYEIARKDFLNDKAWRYYASATRMTGLLNLLLRKVPAISAGNTEGDQYLEQAAAVPASGTAQLDALRAIALYYELYQEQDDWRAAALALARFASDIDELPSALMLEQAGMALLRLPQPARRRFSLLMTIAAHRYQKTGPKILADRCGRQALSLFSSLDCKDWVAFRNHLERMLGRLAFNDGNAEVALMHFLRVLVDVSSGEDSTIGESQDFLDDLQLAWASLGNNADKVAQAAGLKLPAPIFDTRRTSIRSETLNPAVIRSDTDAWMDLDQQFVDRGFPYRPEGSDAMQTKPSTLLEDVTLNIFTTGETLTVDLWAENALDVPVVLSDISLVFQTEIAETQVTSRLTLCGTTEQQLEPRSATKVSIRYRAALQGSFTLERVEYRYNRMLHCKQDLTRKGARLHATKAHMLEPSYSDDTSLKIIVKPPQPRLSVESQMALPTLLEGETYKTIYILKNTGTRGLRDLRVLCDNSLMSFEANGDSPTLVPGLYHLTDNTLEPHKPSRIHLPESGLQPGESIDWHLYLRGASVGHHKLRWLFTFYETNKTSSFKVFTACHAQEMDVVPSISITSAMLAPDDLSLSAKICNTYVPEKVEVTGLGVISPVWQVPTSPPFRKQLLDPVQDVTIHLPIQRIAGQEEPQSVMKSTVLQLEALIQGHDLAETLKSSVDVTVSSYQSSEDLCTLDQVCKTRTAMRRVNLQQHFPALDESTLAKVFPLFKAGTLDLLVSWSLPLCGRQGWHYLPDLECNTGVEAIQELAQRASGILGGGRSEESAQDRSSLIEQIQQSDLVKSTCPLAITQKTDTAGLSDKVSSCTFVLVNCGLETVTCHLELLSGAVNREVSRCPPVRWKGRLHHRCSIQSGKEASFVAHYIKPSLPADQGSWQASIAGGQEAWRITGSESLVAG